MSKDRAWPVWITSTCSWHCPFLYARSSTVWPTRDTCEGGRVIGLVDGFFRRFGILIQRAAGWLRATTLDATVGLRV